jgi:hypothetical protein
VKSSVLSRKSNTQKIRLVIRVIGGGNALSDRRGGEDRFDLDDPVVPL